MTSHRHLGFFTRLLDAGDAATRYRAAAAQVRHAEAEGFDVAWVAQHHFHEDEGGLPSPFVFLAQVAAQTTRIRLGTGVITLPMELPIRVAEDAAVLDLISGGRVELGLGSGGNPEAFVAFGLSDAIRREVFAERLQELLTALAGKELRGGDRLYPAHPSLLERLWYATFSAEGGRLAGELGAGLMLSRTQPRPKDRPGLSLAEIQEPVIEAYVKALPSGVAPRIMASRSVFVTDRRETAWDHAAVGLSRYHARLARLGRMPAGEVPPVEALVRRQDVHLGTAEEVIASLRADAVLRHATELAVQVHSIDPPHELVLRSIEKVAREVAPVLGFGRNA